MLYSDEIYIEDFKRTYTEAYRKGFIDGFNERGYLLTYIGNDHIKAEQGEPQTIRCPKCGRTDYIRDMEKDMGIKGSHYKYKCINCNTYIKTEPTISKMEQVDKPERNMAEDIVESFGFKAESYRQAKAKTEQTERECE